MLRPSTPHSPLHLYLTARQHTRQRALLGGIDGQVVIVLDVDPHGGVGAIVGGCERGGVSIVFILRAEWDCRACRRRRRLTQWWLPAFGTLIAFGLVHIVGHSDELRDVEVIGESLTSGCRPG